MPSCDWLHLLTLQILYHLQAIKSELSELLDGCIIDARAQGGSVGACHITGLGGEAWHICWGHTTLLALG